MTTYDNRLSALRGVLGAAGLDGFIVTIADEHGSEYVGAYAQRLHWLTGFAGSAGTAIVLANRAAFLSDGRYTLQAVAEVDGALYEHVNSVETPLTTWLAANIAPDTRIGFDPWLVTERTAQAWRKTVEGRGAKLIAVTRNPVDAIWSDRPAPSPAPLTVQPEQFAGPSAAEKRTQIAATLETVGADVAIVTALDGVAWAFNIRATACASPPTPRSIPPSASSRAWSCSPIPIAPRTRSSRGWRTAARAFWKRAIPRSTPRRSSPQLRSQARARRTNAMVPRSRDSCTG